MTDAEFNEWFSYHASCFTGLHSWLRKFPAATDAQAKQNHQSTQERILQRWFRVLEEVGLADAKKATDRLHSGEEDEPKGFDKHPGAVRRIARKVRPGAQRAGREEGPRIVGGVESVDCVTCQDYGRVWVWHPDDMGRAAAGKLEPPFKPCYVACTCRAGNRYQRTHRLFDPTRDLPIRRADDDGEWRTHDQDDPAEQEALRQFVAGIAERVQAARPAADPQQEIPF